MSAFKWLDDKLKCVIKHSIYGYWKKPLHVKLQFKHHESQNEILYLLYYFCCKMLIDYGIYVKCISNLFCSTSSLIVQVTFQQEFIGS
jgi:hypothetical protein